MDGSEAGTVFAAMAALPVERVAAYLAAESPQTVAALLLLFPCERAAAVVTALPEPIRLPSVRCMVSTRPLSAAVRDAVVPVLRDTLGDDDGRREFRPVGHRGADRRAEVERILDALPAEARVSALAALDTPPPPPSADPGTAVAGWEPPVLSAGLAALVNTTRVTVERMPMLEVVMDRYVRLLATSLRHALDRPVMVEMLALRSERFGDWLNRPAAGERLLAPLRIDAWDHYALLAADRAALDAMGGAQMGGSADAAGLRVGRRPLTPIDHALAGLVLGLGARELGVAFAPVSPVSFALDRLEDDPRFAAIDRPFNAAFIAEMAVSLDGMTGRLDLVLPYGALEPVREVLRGGFMGERFGRDGRWATHLRDSLVGVRVPVRARAGTAAVALGHILRWVPGALVLLDGGPGRVALETCGGQGDGVVLAYGALGVRGGRWAVAVGEEPAEMETAPLRPIEGGTPAADDGLAPVERVTVPVAVIVGGAELTMSGGDGLTMAGIRRPGRGGVIELDRWVGEPVTLLAGGRLVACGDLVRVGGRLGVVLTEMATR